MPPVIEVYNRVVQCQLNQRYERRGRRRRHLSEQSIKTETPSMNDVSCSVIIVLCVKLFCYYFLLQQCIDTIH